MSASTSQSPLAIAPGLDLHRAVTAHAMPRALERVVWSAVAWVTVAAVGAFAWVGGRGGASAQLWLEWLVGLGVGMLTLLAFDWLTREGSGLAGAPPRADSRWRWSIGSLLAGLMLCGPVFLKSPLIGWMAAFTTLTALTLLAALVRGWIGSALVDEASGVDWRGLIALTKPGLNALVLVTTWLGYAAAVGEGFEWAACLLTVAATGLVAAGASALNQFMERDTDARMDRTARRPLPAGRISPRLALTWGSGLAVAGLLGLVAFSGLAPAFLAAVTLSVYLFLYTPLKRITSLATLAGAVAGALPPTIGWAAGGGAVEPLAVVLFAILLLWQVPHFLAIAWKYRDQYRRAGLPMLTVTHAEPRVTGRQSVLYTLALAAVLALAPVRGLVAGWSLVPVLVLAAVLLAMAWRFTASPTAGRTRALFIATIACLPLLLAVIALATRSPLT